MSDSANAAPTLDPIAPVQDGERESEAVLESAPVATPGRLDSPIERTDLGTPEVAARSAIACSSRAMRSAACSTS